MAMSILATERKVDGRRPGATLKRNRRVALVGLFVFIAALTLSLALFAARIGPPGTAF